MIPNSRDLTSLWLPQTHDKIDLEVQLRVSSDGKKIISPLKYIAAPQTQHRMADTNYCIQKGWLF